VTESDEWVPTPSRTITLEQDGDDLIMPIPDDLLKEAGWNVGDTISFNVQEDGTLILTKKEEK
jgi:antitoxin component of MazEF toxin-antitoxin module